LFLLFSYIVYIALHISYNNIIGEEVQHYKQYLLYLQSYKFIS